MSLPNPNPDDEFAVNDDDFEIVLDNKQERAFSVKSERLKKAMMDLQNAGIASFPFIAPLAGRTVKGITPQMIGEMALRAVNNSDKKFVALVGALLVWQQVLSQEMSGMMSHLMYHCPNHEEHAPPNNAADVIKDKIKDMLLKKDPDTLEEIDDDDFNNLFRFNDKKKKGGQAH